VVEQGGAGGFWGRIAALALHPVQLKIIEAMRWIDRPLSTSELALVFQNEESLSTLAYHVRRLAAIGVLRRVGRSSARGPVKKLYRLAFD